MDGEVGEHGGRLGPQPVEREHRRPCRKRRRGARHAEVRMQPAQRTSPQVPLVDVAREHRGVHGLVLQHPQQLLHLQPALAGPQAEVRRDEPQRPHRGVDDHVERTARLAARHRQIEPRRLEDREARQHEVAVVAAPALARPAFHGVEPGRGDQRVAQSGCAALADLLQRHDVGAHLGDHLRDALRGVAAVAADARVHVPRRDRERPTGYPACSPSAGPGSRGRARRRRIQRTAANGDRRHRGEQRERARAGMAGRG